MKDENDKVTLELDPLRTALASQRHGCTSAQGSKKAHWYKPAPKPKRGDFFMLMVREEAPEKLPAAVKDKSLPGAVFAKRFVPVSFAAQDWGVSSRRIRFLLVAKRLEGRREENGYWEVAYPYRYQEGTRGPRLRRSQSLKKSELRAE